MSDLSAWAPRSDGFPGVQSQQSSSSSLFPSSQQQQQPNPHPSAISAESWREAEQATQQIIQRIQPTVASEKSRMAVVRYVQRLIRGHLLSEVFPFGSVPLKTYLPDGDVDLTAVCSPKTTDVLASSLCSVLQLEEKNKNAEFEVKDVQYIRAEVKLVKCLIQNIVVDISFNQIGGLCTLCFLEQVDHLIQKDHLFKRSIILIKAWCYYESRILGAHHGLISTYALETLVLYIFHLFHSSLDGPLAVLYRFLDYFSKFDWDNYCISLHGPISLSSLPELVAEAPETDGGSLLLSEEFLDNCVRHFSASTMGLESTRKFPKKHLNIVDLLKENNNLGRSVGRGNFYRIRSAFAYGARKLGRILLLPQEYIADEIHMFFTNTMERHGNGERPDVQGFFPSCEDGIMSENNGSVFVSSSDSYGALCEEASSIEISSLDREHGTCLQSGRYPSDRHQTANAPHKYSAVESCSYVEENAVSSRGLASDPTDLAINPSVISKTMNETCESSLAGSEAGASSSGNVYHAPHLFYSPENGIVSVVHNQIHQVDPRMTKEKSSMQPCEEDVRLCLSTGFYEAKSSGNATSWLSGSCGMSARNEGGDTSLSDLEGNYHLHYKSLLYARWCQDYFSGGLVHPVHPVHPSSPSYFDSKIPWNALHGKNGFLHVNANGTVPGLPFVPSPRSYSTKQLLDFGANGMEDTQKSSEDIQKPSGTGIYFPSMNYRSYREKQRTVKGRNRMSASKAPSPATDGGESTTLIGVTLPKKKLPEPSPPPEAPVPSGSGCRKLNLMVNVPQPVRPATKETSQAEVSVREPKLDFRSFASVALGISSPGISKKSDPVTPNSLGSGQVPPSTVQKPRTGSNGERTAKPYQLKDDSDFPPLGRPRYDSNFPPLSRTPRGG